MPSRQTLAVLALVAAQPASAQETAQTFPPTYSSTKPTTMGEVRHFLGVESAAPSSVPPLEKKVVEGSGPAWRWYGYGTSAPPGVNPMAPRGTYAKPPIDWFARVGATPGAVPIGSRPEFVPDDVPIRRVEEPRTAIVMPQVEKLDIPITPQVERIDLPVSMPKVVLPPTESGPIIDVRPEPIPAEELPAPTPIPAPIEPKIEVSPEEFDWKAAPKNAPTTPAWPKVVAEEVPDGFRPEGAPKPSVVIPPEPDPLPVVPIVMPDATPAQVKPLREDDISPPSLPPTGTPVTRDTSGHVVPATGEVIIGPPHNTAGDVADFRLRRPNAALSPAAGVTPTRTAHPRRRWGQDRSVPRRADLIHGAADRVRCPRPR